MGRPRLRVVLAEDGLTEAGLTLRSLCAETGRILELVRVARREDLGAALRTHCPDIALLKFSLLQPDASNQLRVLQADSPFIPFILLAEAADKVNVESCLAMGATDYLLEGFLDERTMNRALCAAMGQTWPMQQQRPDAAGAVGSNWERVGEREWMFTVYVGDSDRFEERVQAELTDFVKRCVRKTDSVEQISGGELMVRLRDVDEVKSAAVQRRLEACLRKHPTHFEISIESGLVP